MSTKRKPGRPPVHGPVAQTALRVLKFRERGWTYQRIADKIGITNDYAAKLFQEYELVEAV